jgi:membrane protein involved in colicin uptake
MAKIAKAAAKTAAQKTDKDLFSDLGASPRRIAGKATRAAKPTSGAEARYTARDIEVLEAVGLPITTTIERRRGLTVEFLFAGDWPAWPRNQVAPVAELEHTVSSSTLVLGARG